MVPYEEGNPDFKGYPGEDEESTCPKCGSDNIMFGSVFSYGLEFDCWSCVECGHNWGGDL